MRQIARDLDPEHERGKCHNMLGDADLRIIVAGNRGLDDVAARLGGGLDARIERDLCRPTAVGARIALQDRCRAERVLAGKAGIARKQKALAARRRPLIGELRNPPFDRPVRY